MPICRTCKGQYSPQEASCSICNQPVSHCTCSKRTVGRQQLCPRCNSDVGVWERNDMTLREFALEQGGILGLMPLVIALAVWALFLSPPREESLYYFPLLTFVTVGMCVLLFFVLYNERLFWWEHLWAAQVYRVRRVSLGSLITLTAIGGIFLIALWWMSYVTSGKPEDLIGKMFFAAVYVLSYVCLTVALTLGFVNQYIARLEKWAPPPIFVNTKHLSQVVVDTAIQSINLARSVPAGEEPVYEIVEALRIPEDGGIHVLLRECKVVEYPNADGGKQKKWMEMLWRIRADRWGRVQSLRPGSVEPYSSNKRAFREIGRRP